MKTIYCMAKEKYCKFCFIGTLVLGLILGWLGKCICDKAVYKDRKNCCAIERKAPYPYAAEQRVKKKLQAEKKRIIKEDDQKQQRARREAARRRLQEAK